MQHGPWARIDTGATPLTPLNPCRFCKLYATAVLAFAALFGAVTALQLALTAGPKLALFAAQLVFHDGVRSIAPAASGTALLLALVLWAHPLPARQVEVEQLRIFKRALLVALPGYLVAVVVSSAAGAGLLQLGFGGAASILELGLAGLGWRDFALGARGVLVDTLLILFLAKRFAVRLQASGLSLPAKLILVVTVTVGLRVTAALLLSILS